MNNGPIQSKKVPPKIWLLRRILKPNNQGEKLKKGNNSFLGNL